MSFLNVRRTAVPTNFALPIATTPTGVVTANAFPDWNSPALTSFDDINFSNVRTLGTPTLDGKIIATSKVAWRDREIFCWGRRFYLLSRFDPVTGRGIIFSYVYDSLGGTIEAYEVAGVNPAQPPIPYTNGTVRRALFVITNMASKYGPGGSVQDIGFSNSYTTGDRFSFITAGVDYVVKYKGIEFLRIPIKGWSWMYSGLVAVAPFGGYGMIGLEVSHMAQIGYASDFSNPNSPQLVATDVGFKSMKSAGSMVAGSNQLTLSNPAMPVAAGDNIIVAVGGTIDAAARGTEDVGGAYPLTNRVNGTLWDLLASTPPNDGTFTAIWNPGDPDHGRNIETGYHQDVPAFFDVLVPRVTISLANPAVFTLVDDMAHSLVIDSAVNFTTNGALPSPLTRGPTYYVKTVPDYRTFTVSATKGGTAISTLGSSSSGELRVWLNHDYYEGRLNPAPLMAKVVSRTGAVCTLDKTAVKTTNNADLFFDNWPAAFALLMDTADTVPASSVRIPAGDWGFSDSINIAAKHNWTVRGDGDTLTHIWAPKGCNCQFWTLSGCDNFLLEEMAFHGNQGDTGYGMRHREAPGSPLNYNLLKYPFAITGTGNFITFRRSKLYNVFTGAFGGQSCRDSLVEDVINYQQIQQRKYIQWQIVFADGQRNTLRRCFVDSDFMTAAFELFREDGSTMEDCGARNGYWSNNSSGNSSWIRPYDTIQANSMGIRQNTDPMFNFNANIDTQAGPSVGVWVGNPTRFETLKDPHGYSIGTTLVFTTTNTMPIGLVQGQIYYVIESIDDFNFKVSLTPGGASIVTSGTYAGIIRVYPSTPTTFTNGSSVITCSAPHGFTAMISTCLFVTSGTLPAPLLVNRAYNVITTPTSTTFTIADFRTDPAIVIAGTGSGTHSMGRAYGDLTSKGILVVDPKIIQEGFVDGVAGMATFSISTPNVVITGTHPNGTGAPYTKGVNPKGYIVNPVDPSYGGTAFLVAAAGCEISGIRMTGAVADEFKTRVVVFGGGTLKHQNLVMESGASGPIFSVGSVTAINAPITNAAWLAAHTPNDG